MCKNICFAQVHKTDIILLLDKDKAIPMSEVLFGKMTFP